MYNYKELLDWKFNYCKWTMSDPTDYSTLVWTDKKNPKPSKKELEDKIDSLNASKIVQVQALRANEYPSIQEQLDLIFHEGLDVWKEQIQAIKNKYPKP